MVYLLIMQKKSLSLQAFRVIALIFLSLLAFVAPVYGQQINQQPIQGQQNALLKGEMSGFKFFPAPKEIPELVFKDAAGQPVALSAFRGKLVLLTLWATWCPYCARELPTLDKLQDALGKEKFMVLPVSVDKEGPSFVKKYLQEKSLNLPTYSDPRNSISTMMGSRGIPFCFLIDQSGRHIGYISGETNWAASESIELLKAFIR